MKGDKQKAVRKWLEDHLSSFLKIQMSVVAMAELIGLVCYCNFFPQPKGFLWFSAPSESLASHKTSFIGDV